MQEPTSSEFVVTVNGEAHTVRGFPPDTTLLNWLRGIGKVGTKCGCNEGDCGACTVTLLDSDTEGHPAWRAINSCIALLPMFAGRELLTVEGLAANGQLHPVQECMVKNYGSQCGYCTPGLIMSLAEAHSRSDCDSPEKIADQLCGNICRCTGYRAIRDAAIEAIQSKPASGVPAAFADRQMLRKALSYEDGAVSFFRPTSLRELFRLRATLPESILVAGATEIGVLINKRGLRYPRLISTEFVEELREIAKRDGAWHFGGAASLTNIEQALGSELPAFRKMLRLFASRQIRSRATLGGNLATASPIGDSAPILLALDASVVLSSPAASRTLPLHEFLLGYRKTALLPDEVIRSVVIPEQAGRESAFFKVSKRREMDISTVSAAFAIERGVDGHVTLARIAYGGVAAMPLRAVGAEAMLLGRTLEEAGDEVIEALRNEFKPIDDVRGSAEFRRGLVVSLWEKFVRGEEVEEPQWVPGTLTSESDDTRALAHESAIGHVTGRAEYVDDIAQKRRMLEILPVLAPHARARILRRDASRARLVPGVRAVLMAEDVPGENNVGVSRKDEILLADVEVFFHSQIVALVVGESAGVCRAAAALVEVEYEPLPAVLSIADAIEAESFHTEPNYMRRGDWSSALQRAPQMLDGVFDIGGQEHFYLETHAAWAEVDGDGNVFVSSSSQHPSEIQTIVADVLHLPRSRVVVQVPRMGGGFGGKETQGNTWAALVALAALKTGAPVRVQLDRDLDMQLTGKRHPFRAAFQVGFDQNGTLLALKCDLISNGGWSLDLSMPVTDRAMFHVDNAYYIPHIEVSGRVAKTNVTSQTAFRGFGGPQGMLVIEEILARIAHHLNLPPEQVRERNLYRGSGETNTTHYGEEVEGNPLRAIWEQLQEESSFGRRRAEIAGWNRAHVGYKRGLAITPVKFGISFTYTPYNQAGALVHLYRDGTAQVNHGGTEMGQGLHTKVLGIAMRELGLPRPHIRIMTTATDKVPNTSATAASSGSDLNGAAVRDACVQLRDRLVPFAVKMLQERFGHPVEAGKVRFENAAVYAADDPNERVAFLEVVDRAYMERVSLSATGYYATPGIHWDRVAGKGKPFSYFACGAAVSEVLVDGDTGMTRVLRVDILHDVGRSLNPGVDRGQIEGGFVQGMGWLTTEDLRWNASGILQSHSASTYQVPAISDAPADFRVSFFDSPDSPAAIHGSKAVGEPPLMLAISVREAIRDAVGAFAPFVADVTLPSPATPEAVFRAIRRNLADRSDAAPTQG